MSVQHANFNVDQGSDFKLYIQLLDKDDQPVDATNAVIIGQIRKTASTKHVSAEFAIEPIDPSIGTFFLKLNGNESSKLHCTPSYFAERTNTEYSYDVEVHFPNGEINRIMQGILYVSPEVTR
mgnify:CR=1 FL=1